jgi:hypothetical protein
VRQDEHGHAERRVVSPPAVCDRIVLPTAFAAAEHASAHQRRPGGVERFPDDVVVGIPRAAGFAVQLAPARQFEHPLVESVASFAERPFDSPVRAGDESVERHREIERQSSSSAVVSGSLLVVLFRRKTERGDGTHRIPSVRNSKLNSTEQRKYRRRDQVSARAGRRRLQQERRAR